ncbi:alpha-glucuronidase family glycosyl hydrolase [Streptomyces shenzhenensis]|uniref:Xylan alpha-1,2-glucuronidase n=1 Tax=Streptomyces shenzhenensis TaxID=943815 RepID=A0A3M0I7X0_9ACTN|nr:alpha-glucuronidase family glycosyl hydrolase [Streptomyces shenzhenensis]RMB84874.1 glycoside hydrolase [Streptomyces shenzhenensis]
MAQYQIGRRHVLQASALAFAAAAAPWSTSAASAARLVDEDGYELWLRYPLVSDPDRLDQYRRSLTSIARHGDGPVLENAEAELRRAVEGLTGHTPADVRAPKAAIVVGRVQDSSLLRSYVDEDRDFRLREQGFVIKSVGARNGRRRIFVIGLTERGVLSGVFHLIRLLQLHTPLSKVSTRQNPAVGLRMMNHWDNRDGSIERGYAGTTIFGWDELPVISGRHVDYARAMASIGINASVINNVNADADFISSGMLDKLAPLAALFHSWGISLWLSVDYASPLVLTTDDADPIATADPADPRVRQWWSAKAGEIFSKLDGFGGFLVKANSEGRPGPLDYGRTHAEGANMLAKAVHPHGGKIVWRSFVHEDFSDWAEYQYRTFAPLDGDFDDNVVLQTKYGPIDFQVREPVHPLFGRMRRTHQMVELQLTQEYTGHAVHTCYLAPMWREVLSFPTQGPVSGPTVAEILAEGSLRKPCTGIAGVSNFGNDRDWTGYQLGAANTYAFGRMCWDTDTDPRDLAEEWVRMTFGTDTKVTRAVVDILAGSRETYEAYSSPLGLGYFTNPGGDHFEPNPRATLFQSHHTTAEGTGFDRTTATGSGFTGQYPKAWQDLYESLETCPDELLLFMHWVRYDHRLRSGSTVIQHIYDTHFQGVEEAKRFLLAWRALAGRVDGQRHDDIEAAFTAQLEHARLWRDVVVGFYFDHSRRVDERRTWFQVALGPRRVLLGGRANLLPVDITNASKDKHQLRVRLRPPNGQWTSATATGEADGARTAELELSVAPTLAGTVAPADFEVSPKLTRLDGAIPDLVVAPDGARCRLALNAGPDGGASMPGYTPLKPSSAWSPQAGFGWVGDRPTGRDRGGEPLIRDMLYNDRSRVLRIAVPAGRHTAYALVGDTGATASPTRIAVDGRTVATSPRQPSGTFTWLELPLDGGASGRTLDLTFTGEGGPWRLNALALPDESLPKPSLLVMKATTEQVWWTGRPNEVTLLVRNTGDTDREVTAGLTTPDSWETTSGTVTVRAGTDAELTVTATPDSKPGFATVGIRVDSGNEEIERGRSVPVVTAPHADDVVLALDAGPDGSPLVPGWTRLTPGDRYDDERGFGWTKARPDPRDRGTGDALRRDFVTQKIKDSAIRLRVPAGRHTVWVLSGDMVAESAITTISEHGTVLGSSGDDTLPARTFVWFAFELDGGASGRTAELDITGSKLNGLWRIGALVIV